MKNPFSPTKLLRLLALCIIGLFISLLDEYLLPHARLLSLTWCCSDAPDRWFSDHFIHKFSPMLMQTMTKSAKFKGSSFVNPFSAVLHEIIWLRQPTDWSGDGWKAQSPSGSQFDLELGSEKWAGTECRCP